MTERDVRRPGFGRRLLLLCALACLCLASMAMASEYHGQVTFGGLPVPGSTVAVTATQGSKKAVAITDDQGVFSFADLADGTWSIDIEMTGFAPIKQDITVVPNGTAGTFELKLMTLDQIRASAKPVKEEAAPVETTSATAPATPTAATGPAGKAPAETTAAKGAATATARTTAAAATPNAPGPAQDATSQQANDGMLINGSVNNAATSQYAMSQAFGNSRNNGKSLYNYGLSLVLDNSALDATQFSVNGYQTPKPAYNNVTAGVTIGGPLKIPHLLTARNAPYFFVGYQRTQSTRVNIQDALLPTAAETAGNLSQLPNVTTIYVPTSGLSAGCLSALPSGTSPGSPFPGNTIPSACISMAATSLLGYYPQNVPNGSPYNYQAALPSNTRQDSFQTRLSKGFGNKNFVNGYVGMQSTRTGSTSLFDFHDNNDGFGINTNASWYHRFTQRLSMNTSYNFSRSRSQNAPFFANRVDVSANAGITGNDQTPTYWGPPSLGFTQSTITGLSDGTSSYNRSANNSVGVNLQWNRFRHNVTVGGDFNRREWNYLQESNPEGSLNFTGAATQSSAGAGGSDFADFLLGLPDTSTIAFGNADKYLRQSVYDLYATDDFRISPELSVNVGARWEYGAPITETKGRLVNLDIAPNFTAYQPVLGSNPTGPQTGESYPSSLLRPDRIGIAPNVSLAWRPISGSSLLVRSSYAIYHDTSVYQATALAMAQQAPLSNSLSITNSASCRFTILSPFAVPSNCPSASSSATADNFAVDPNFRVGYAQMWQLSAQRDLPGSLQLIVTYNGIKGTRGVQEFYPNTCPPQATGASPCYSAPSGYVYRTSNGDSTREAGIVQLRRRLRSGFTASATYTFSKSIDDDYSLGGQGPVTSGSISQGGSMSGQPAQNWQDLSAQRGLSSFDQRNVLSTQLQYTTGMGINGHTLLSGWRGVAYKEWTVVATVNAASGLPLTPIAPLALNGSTCFCVRANYLGGQVHIASGGRFLNTAAFGVPALGQYGNAGRDSITGPDQFSFNASMDRTFRLHDRYNLETRLDATNVLNHVVFTGWNTTAGSSQFGAATAANGMRSMQITMRLRF
jgi:hypothetical protein